MRFVTLLVFLLYGAFVWWLSHDPLWSEYLPAWIISLLWLSLVLSLMLWAILHPRRSL